MRPDDGPSHPHTKGCHHHFNHVEERRELRPPTVASASRLSLSGEQGFPSCGFLGWWQLRFWRARFEGEYQSMRLACASAPSHILHAMPPRIKMWSSTFLSKCEVVRNVELARQSRTNGGRRYFQLHISEGLKRLQPGKDRGVFAPRCARLAGNRFDQRNCFAFHL